MRILTHGIGGAKDLPLPVELMIAGAVAALAVSFIVLALAWRMPRYDAGPPGRPAPAWLSRLVDSRGWRIGLRLIGLLLFAYTAMTAVFGPDLLINPFFGIFYVWWWVGLVPLSLAFGPVWRAISPVRTINALIARLTGGDPAHGALPYPERLGYWPAAIGLYAFVWLELVYPHSTDLGPVRLWAAAYIATMLVGGTLFGEQFYERADPFEVYSSLVAKLSIWGRHEGALVIRSPLANLATLEPRRGLVAVVAVLFGSTAFDSFKESPPWLRFTQGEWLAGMGSFAPGLANNVALLAFCVGVGVLLALASVATPAAHVPHRQLPDRFAHSIVPIVVGYIVAHYLTYLVNQGQLTLIYASDPFSTGANWFGTANWEPNLWLSFHPTLLAVIKVLAVVAGHVVAVVAAHDRAIALLPRRHQLTGQLPMLFAMVGFTVGGLWLLFSS